ncbi:helix-turn-helix domain-containing protein [Alloscardovia venturai]|uniref:Helix-turn-helix domain-containing protein n=2 Tax=Alloscardovia venturai TaxID=1769421 RepID=A0ABW2Y5R1_9BIFI
MRQLMKSRGISQEQLAQARGITQGAFSNKLSNKRPWNTDDITFYSAYFDMPVTSIIS